MKQISGTSILKKIAIGTLVMKQSRKIALDGSSSYVSGNGDVEMARFHASRQQLMAQLALQEQRAKETMGNEEALIFQVQQMILEDEEFESSIYHYIDHEQFLAERAIKQTAIDFEELMLRNGGDQDLQRIHELDDLCHCLICLLPTEDGQTIGQSQGWDGAMNQKIILMAQRISPLEMMTLDLDIVQGIILEDATQNAHTVILAKALRLPMLIGVDLSQGLRRWEGKLAVLDGTRGQLTIDPKEGYMAFITAFIEEVGAASIARDQSLKALKGLPSVSLAGEEMKLYANVSSLSQVAEALENDAEGIGLLRTEMLFLGAKQWPSEEEQYAIYREVLNRMQGREVYIRTFDISTDKLPAFAKRNGEENPALGYRGIRISLSEPEVFQVQLRALLRAAYDTNIEGHLPTDMNVAESPKTDLQVVTTKAQLGILFPMISSVEELQRAKALLNECEKSLIKEGLIRPSKPISALEANVRSDHGKGAGRPYTVGIMIETPASVMMAAELAKEVDFFNIGSNDLSQYTLAMDRQNPKVEPFFDATNPAIMRMIVHAIEEGHRAGITVGLCGELASDVSVCARFLHMGMDNLSVIPERILPLRRIIRTQE